MLAVVTISVSGIATAAIMNGSYTTAASVKIRETRVVLQKPDTHVGNVLLAALAILGGDSEIVHAPAGWSLIRRSDNDSDITLLTYYKIVDPAEPASYTWSIDGQTQAEGSIAAYSGVDTVHPIDVVSDSVGTGKTATAPRVMTARPGATVVAVFAANTTGKTKTGSFGVAQGLTERFDVANAPTGPALAYDETSTANPGAVGPYTATVTGHKARDWSAQSIVLNPSSSVSFDNAAKIPYGVPTHIDYTVGSEKNRALLVCEYTVNDNSLAPTYDGVPLTLIGKSQYHNVGNQGIAVYMMINPPSGSHVLTERTAGSEMESYVASYSGVDQTIPPDAVSQTGADGQQTITDSVNTSAQGDWLVMCTSDSGSGSSNDTFSSNGVIRLQDNTLSGVMVDSGVGLPKGTNSLSVSMFGNIFPTYSNDVLIALQSAQ